MNNKTVKKFELDPKTVKVKELLNKDFLELEIKAISTANPNRNGSAFSTESLEKAIPTFYNKPILGSFSVNQDDFRAHEGELSYDNDYEQLYYDYTDEIGETPLGLIRGDDKVEVIHDKKDGLDWLKFTCAIWVKYNYKQVKKLLKSKDGHKKISVEVEVTDSEIDENGIEQIKGFIFDGVTILGDKYETGIADANMTILDMVDNALFQKQQKCLAFAYDKLEQQNVETPNEVKISEKDSNIDFDKKENPVDNEETPQVSMEEKVNQEGGIPAMQLTMRAKIELLQAALEKALYSEESNEGEERVCYCIWVMDICDKFVYYELGDEKFRCPYAITELGEEHSVELDLNAQERVVSTWSVFSESEAQKEVQEENFEHENQEGEKEEDFESKEDPKQKDKEKEPSEDKPENVDAPKDNKNDNKEKESCGEQEDECNFEDSKEPEEPDESEDPKEQESCDNKEQEACDDGQQEKESCDDNPQEQESCDDSKEQEACGSPQEQEACGNPQEQEACAPFESKEDDKEDDKEDGEEDFKDESNDENHEPDEDKDNKEDDFNCEKESKFSETLDPNAEPLNVDIDGQTMTEIIQNSTASIKAPEVITNIEGMGTANAGVAKVLDNVQQAVLEGDPDGTANEDGSPINPETVIKQPKDDKKERDKQFVSNADTSNINLEELLKKYNELEEKFNKLNNAAKQQEAEKLIKFGRDFINADEVVDEESKQKYIAQVEEKCNAFEFTSEDEVTKFAKELMAMYYYEHQSNYKKKNNSEEFTLDLNKPTHINNGASNKLKDAINKLNYLNKEE